MDKVESMNSMVSSIVGLRNRKRSLWCSHKKAGRVSEAKGADASPIKRIERRLLLNLKRSEIMTEHLQTTSAIGEAILTEPTPGNNCNSSYYLS